MFSQLCSTCYLKEYCHMCLLHVLPRISFPWDSGYKIFVISNFVDILWSLASNGPWIFTRIFEFFWITIDEHIKVLWKKELKEKPEVGIFGSYNVPLIQCPTMFTVYYIPERDVPVFCSPSLSLVCSTQSLETIVSASPVLRKRAGRISPGKWQKLQATQYSGSGTVSICFRASWIRIRNYLYESRSLHQQAKKLIKTLISAV